MDDPEVCELPVDRFLDEEPVLDLLPEEDDEERPELPVTEEPLFDLVSWLRLMPVVELPVEAFLFSF